MFFGCNASSKYMEYFLCFYVYALFWLMSSLHHTVTIPWCNKNGKNAIRIEKMQ